jgi:hypothetical protein
MIAELIVELRRAANEAKRRDGASRVTIALSKGAAVLDQQGVEIVILRDALATADAALAFIGDHPRGGVVIEGEPSGDRDAMIERARDARRKTRAAL